jgi:hypothetical protein
MLRRIRSRLTYANVMVTILAFVVLGGGTALASFVITDNSQVAPGTISGHSPPAGKHANIIGGSVNAQDLASGAVTAPKLDAVAKFRRQDSTPTSNFQPLLSKGGLTIRYRCIDNGDGVNPTLVATSSVDHADITMGFITGTDGFGTSFFDLDRDFNPGEIFDLSHDRHFGEATAVYSTPGGRVVTLNYGLHDTPCYAHGIAIER